MRRINCLTGLVLSCITTNKCVAFPSDAEAGRQAELASEGRWQTGCAHLKGSLGLFPAGRELGFHNPATYLELLKTNTRPWARWIGSAWIIGEILQYFQALWTHFPQIYCSLPA